MRMKQDEGEKERKTEANAEKRMVKKNMMTLCMMCADDCFAI